jgi:hypothetical protein
MLLKRLGFLPSLLKITIPVFLLHLLIFQIPSLATSETHFFYTIPFLYFLYFIFSVIILIALFKVSKNNFDNVGMTFLISTSIKMAVSYFILRPILNSANENTIEKVNFFTIFILFLAIETIITIRLLNKNQ